MGIMNKMKTVALKDLSWSQDSAYFITTNSQPTSDAKFPGSNIAFIGYCSMDYTPIGIGPLNASTDKRIAFTSSKTLYVRDSRFTTVEAFKQHLQDENAMLTYETVDSVEEKIVSLIDAFKADYFENVAFATSAGEEASTIFGTRYRGFIMPCQPNTLYKITRERKTNNRFAVFGASFKPTASRQASSNRVVWNNEANELTYTTADNETYLIGYLSNQADSTDIGLRVSTPQTEEII